MTTSPNPDPVSGSTDSTTTIGPFQAPVGVAVNLIATSTGSGSVQLLMSTDGGKTMMTPTSLGAQVGTFTMSPSTSVVEQVTEVTNYSQTFYLSLNAISGTTSATLY